MNAVEFVSGNKQITSNELDFNDGLWHSFYHHGSFSNTDLNSCVDTINKTTAHTHKFLKDATHAIITLGTAHVWRHIEKDIVVSNCHKFPNSIFSHYLLSIDDVVSSLETIHARLKSGNPSLQIVFTVSPVRYLNKGMHANQLSKATLLLAIERLQQKYKGLIYFPSYEIMMDDLRDYRFFDEDLVHPSQTAIEYIWEAFSTTFFDEITRTLNNRIAKVHSAINHELLHPESESSVKFKKWLLSEMEQLKIDLPHVVF